MCVTVSVRLSQKVSYFYNKHYNSILRFCIILKVGFAQCDFSSKRMQLYSALVTNECLEAPNWNLKVMSARVSAKVGEETSKF